jgi:hypothetical protein
MPRLPLLLAAASLLPRAAHGLVVDLFTDSGCTTSAGTPMLAQPGKCLAWSSYGLVTQCDPSVGQANVTLYYDGSAPSDTQAPACSGSTLLTATVTGTCTALPSPFNSFYARVSDATCSLGPGPLYQVSLYTSPICNSSSNGWATLPVTGSCAPYPLTSFYAWAGQVAASPPNSLDLNFYLASTCGGTADSGWVGITPDGACNAAISGAQAGYSGARVLVPANFTPPPPPPGPTPADYLLFTQYASSTCSGAPYSLNFEYPTCSTGSGGGSYSYKTRCAGNNSAAFLDSFSGPICSGYAVSSTPMSISPICASGMASYCAGPSLGYPAFQPSAPMTGYVTRTYSTTAGCSDTSLLSGLVRYPVGSCVDTPGSASARVNCTEDGGVSLTNYFGTGCTGAVNGAPQITNRGCTIGASSSSDVICIPNARVPAPPVNYVPASNATNATDFLLVGRLDAREVYTYTAGEFFLGTNGQNPFYLTATLNNPTGANVTVRAGGGPSCSRFADSVYYSGTLVQGRNKTTFSLVNMPCQTPPSLIVAGQPNYCCLLVECNEMNGGCPYLELRAVQFKFKASGGGDNSGAAGGAGGGGGAAGGIIGFGFFVFIVLLVLHCIGVIRVPCFERCFGGGGRRGGKAAFVTSASSSTTYSAPGAAYSAPGSAGGGGGGGGLNVATVITTNAVQQPYGVVPAPTSFYPTVHGGGMSTVAPPANYGQMQQPYGASQAMSPYPYGQASTVPPSAGSATAPWPGAGGQRTYV